MKKIDIAKRRKVMARSKKLGHCICDPSKGCPCTVFNNQAICPCAGERPDNTSEPHVKLTEHVHNAGCASKISASDLEHFLSRLSVAENPAVISGIKQGDDAGIYRITEDLSLVQTVDIFTPCSDDPFQFGKICAANCLSDIYAMGGNPKTALSILCFPIETLHGDIMYQMMAGAVEVFESVGCSLIGGHSIKDEEIKLGFAITGVIDHNRAAELEKMTKGDQLILTKPLGCGVMGFAKRIGMISTTQFSEVESSMAELNRKASEVMLEHGVSACTDITGFGLWGHLSRMAVKSSSDCVIWAESLPSFSHSLNLLKDDVIPGAIERNSEFVGEMILVDDSVSSEYVALGFDAQTSGGLLIAVPEDRLEEMIYSLTSEGVSAFHIGEVISSEAEGMINVVRSR